MYSKSPTYEASAFVQLVHLVGVFAFTSFCCFSILSTIAFEIVAVSVILPRLLGGCNTPLEEQQIDHQNQIHEKIVNSKVWLLQSRTPMLNFCHNKLTISPDKMCLTLSVKQFVLNYYVTLSSQVVLMGKWNQRIHSWHWFDFFPNPKIFTFIRNDTASLTADLHWMS